MTTPETTLAADRPPAAQPDTGPDPTSDAALVARVGAVLATPRRDPADSFVLHAPLELAARAALLPYVRPAARERARARLAAMVAEFEAFGPPVHDPAPVAFDSLASAATRLDGAIAAGDLDEVDATAAWLGRHAPAAELRRLLADALVARTGAAAHAPIFLYQLPRVAPRGELGGELLRGLARELARESEWRLRWLDDEPPGAGAASPAALLDALRATPELGVPGSLFIHPLMAQVDEQGVASRLLRPVVGGVTLEDATRVVLRAAAWSMLQEPPDHAAYGWSHCLTMPQAVLGIAGVCRDATRAIAVAATHVVGFRAALAVRPLVAEYRPAPPAVGWPEALDAGPAVAAAAAWQAADADWAGVVTEVASQAAVHHDAHLVKYTLACIDAAAGDPGARRLYVAAAASLVGWWRANAG
jgi:hypothetical protein